MKKILFGITNLEIGGAERVLVDLANALVDDYDVEILTIYNNGKLLNEIDNKVKITSLIDTSYSNTSFVKRKCISLKLRFNNFRKKLYEKYNDKDIIISFLEGPITHLFSDFDKNKIAWIHTDISKHFDSKKINSYRKDYEKYNKIVLVSESAKKSFNKVYNNEFDNKSIVINNYVDAKRINELSKIECDYVFNVPNFLIVARLVKAKGFERLINIHTLLKKYGLKNYMYVIGDGPLSEELHFLVKKNNIEDSFIFLGEKENPYPYMKSCDVMLMPSLYEGYGMTAIEAKILGKEIISTKTGVIEALGDYKNKTICENTDTDLYRVLKDNIERRMVREEIITEFDNNYLLEEIKSLLEEE